MVDQKKGGCIPVIHIVWRKVVLQTLIFFLVREKWLTIKKNSSLKNHFSRTTSLLFSKKVVADLMADCTVKLRTLARLVLKHMKDFSDCL